MHVTLQALLGAIRRGGMLGAASLAACGGVTSVSGGSAGAGAGGGGSQLSPYSLDALGCSGPSLDGGYYGQCCVSALCYTPLAGGCEAADKLSSQVLSNFPPGSGTCECGLSSGPYAPRADHPTTPAGSCCYLVSAITCTGRPFTIPDGFLLARVENRDDWARPLI